MQMQVMMNEIINIDETLGQGTDVNVQANEQVHFFNMHKLKDHFSVTHFPTYILYENKSTNSPILFWIKRVLNIKHDN